MSEKVQIEVVVGVEGKALYIRSTRIAGPKPWAGGSALASWSVPVERIMEALPREAAATFLREAGWTCIAPVDPNEAIPSPEAGQVWRSPKPKTAPRTVVSVGPHRMYPWAGDRCVFFAVDDDRTYSLNPNAWKRWVRKSGARPV